jgi:predicted Mrr-cat superfamily restriction endonuclease
MVGLDRNRAVWAIAPFNPETGLVDQSWKYDQDHGCVAIGWNLFAGDIGAMDRLTLEREVRKLYPDQPGALSSLWAFYHRMRVGDYVVARTGRSTALGIGRVTSSAYRDDVRGHERAGGYHPWFKPHFRNVTWLSTQQEVFSHYVFPIATVTQLGIHLDEVLSRYDDAGH